MAFEIPVSIQNEIPDEDAAAIKEKQIFVSVTEESVPKPHILKSIRKLAQVLAAQGIACCECPHSQYKLYRLSDCGKDIYRYSLKISCEDGYAAYQFEVTLHPLEQSGNSNDSIAKITHAYCKYFLPDVLSEKTTGD